MNTNKYPEKDIPNDCHCVHCIKDTLAKQKTHNAGECDGCGETVKPGQWSKDIREQVFLCIDCA